MAQHSALGTAAGQKHDLIAAVDVRKALKFKITVHSHRNCQQLYAILFKSHFLGYREHVRILLRCREDVILLRETA